MIRRDERDAPVFERSAAQGRHRGLGLEERLHGREPQGAEERGPEERQLLLQIREALLHLLRRRHAVLGRAALEHVADVDLLALQIDGGDHLVEELSRASDEGKSLEIFVPPRRLTDEHEPGARAPVGEDGVRARLAEAALPALAHHARERAEIVGKVGCVARRADGGGPNVGRGWCAIVSNPGSESAAPASTAGAIAGGWGAISGALRFAPTSPTFVESRSKAMRSRPRVRSRSSIARASRAIADSSSRGSITARPRSRAPAPSEAGWRAPRRAWGGVRCARSLPGRRAGSPRSDRSRTRSPP